MKFHELPVSSRFAFIADGCRLKALSTEDALLQRQMREMEQHCHETICMVGDTDVFALIDGDAEKLKNIGIDPDSDEY